MSLKSLFAAGLIALTALTIPAPSTAQESPALSAESVSDEKITAFVKAAVALEVLRDTYSEHIMAAETEEERQTLIEDADNVGRQLVDKVRGITAEEYQAIANLALQDEALGDRIGEEVARQRQLKTEFEARQAIGNLRFSGTATAPETEAAPEAGTEADADAETATE